jgi:hypothetical protein
MQGPSSRSNQPADHEMLKRSACWGAPVVACGSGDRQGLSPLPAPLCRPRPRHAGARSHGNRRAAARRPRPGGPGRPHRRAHRHASAPAARPAISSMCASSIPGKCADHEPPGRRAAIAPGRAGHATACYRQLLVSSGCPGADVPFGSLGHAPESPRPASSRHRRANGFLPPAHHQPQRTSGKSITANAAPPAFSPTEFLRRLRASETLTSFACARLSRPCLPGS